jgi:hypothetical protein
MNHSAASSSPLALGILKAEAKLSLLKQEIDEIGLPAGRALQLRLEALEIEDHALNRNFKEAQLLAFPDGAKLLKIERLLHHIECEEQAIEQDAQFLQQAAPSSITLAVQTGAQVVEMMSRGMKRILGTHHPLGESVFVNHSHANLTDEYGLAGPLAPLTDVPHESVRSIEKPPSC